MQRGVKGQLAAAFGPIDVEFVLDELAPGKLSDREAKAFAAILWEVLPTDQWLSRHGWKVDGACPRFEDPEDLTRSGRVRLGRP